VTTRGLLTTSGDSMTLSLERPRPLVSPVTRQVTVTHPTGLHVRPAGAIVKMVSHFQSQVRIRYGTDEADASGIFEVLAMGVPRGAEVALLAEGPDAEAVLESLSKLFADDFGLR
jgi:phosphotransferase system HPr (HPr) family protein